jgi:ribose transport system permease protein
VSQCYIEMPQNGIMEVRMMKRTTKILKNFIMMIIIPVATYLFFFLLCQVRGVSGFGVGTDFTVMLRNTVYTGFISLAVSYNLTSGRFDFSVGSTLVLSTILGGMLTLQYNLGPAGLLILSLLFGAILGAVGGAVYIILRLPPMVVSLGVAMIYEAIGFIISKGAGVKLIGKNSLLIWSGQPYIYILCIAIVAVLYILLNKTQFGFDTNSLRSGQEIAVNIGVNEKKNTLICYIIAGVCLGAAGVINLCVLGTVTPELSLGSASYIQNAFMPMFIGNLLAKYFDRNAGVIMGALTQSIIFAGIGKLGIPSAWQSVITGIIVLGFFAYSFNSYKIVEFQMFKEKKLRAEEELRTMNK